jgi:porin
LRIQITSEVYYRIQVTQNLTLTPSLQVTFKPSYTLEKRLVAVFGFRMRFVF